MRGSRFLRQLGPGLLAGVSDDDPSGIGTYVQAGASYGYAMLWTMPLLAFFMVPVQDLSGRLGRATGGLGRRRSMALARR